MDEKYENEREESHAEPEQVVDAAAFEAAAFESAPMPVSLDGWISEQIPDDQAWEHLDNVGPASRMIRESLRSEMHTSSLVAGAYWQSFVNSEQFRRLSSEWVRPSQGASSGMFIVPYGQGGFALLIESSDFGRRAPQVIRAETTNSDLLRGWELFQRRAGTSSL